MIGNTYVMQNPAYSGIRYAISEKGVFATGLLKRVKTELGKAGIKFEVDHRNKAPKLHSVDHKFNLGSIIPYTDQIIALTKTDIYHRGTFVMPTGTGKSLEIALIIAKLGLRTLVVVPNLDIKRQMQEVFCTLFGTMRYITIENVDSPKLKTISNYDLLIKDEAHHAATKTCHTLNRKYWTGIYHRYFFTATDFRNNSEEQLLYEGIAGQTIFRLSYNRAVAEKYIVPIKAFYIEVPKQKTEAFTWLQVYKELVVENQLRNQLIARCFSKHLSEGIYTLCLVKEIKHGNNLVELTQAPFVNGQDDQSRILSKQFSSGLIPGLIGTQGIIGEGTDTKPCQVVIIAGLGKAKSALMQAIGRAFRTYLGKDYACVILVKDNSHKFTRNHFKEQCKIIREEYGVEPIKLELP